jgi:hypothetical protein
VEVDFDIITVGKALLVVGLAYPLSGLVFLLPNPEGASHSSRNEAVHRDSE